MGLGTFFRSIVDSEVMGEQIVSSIESIYRGTRENLPGDDAHLVLGATYLARIRAGGGTRAGAGKLDINNPSVQNITLTESLLFSCLDEHDNSRALALHILQRERMDIWDKYPKFRNELDFRCSRLFRQLENGGALFERYRRRNPKLQIRDISPPLFEMLRSGQLDKIL